MHPGPGLPHAVGAASTPGPQDLFSAFFCYFSRAAASGLDGEVARLAKSPHETHFSRWLHTPHNAHFKPDCSPSDETARTCPHISLIPEKTEVIANDLSASLALLQFPVPSCLQGKRTPLPFRDTPFSPVVLFPSPRPLPRCPHPQGATSLPGALLLCCLLHGFLSPPRPSPRPGQLTSSASLPMPPRLKRAPRHTGYNKWAAILMKGSCWPAAMTVKDI